MGHHSPNKETAQNMNKFEVWETIKKPLILLEKCSTVLMKSKNQLKKRIFALWNQPPVVVWGTAPFVSFWSWGSSSRGFFFFFLAWSKKYLLMKGWPCCVWFVLGPRDVSLFTLATPEMPVQIKSTAWKTHTEKVLTVSVPLSFSCQLSLHILDSSELRDRCRIAVRHKRPLSSCPFCKVPLC